MTASAARGRWSAWCRSAPRCSRLGARGVLSALGAAAASWFGASHLVAARTGYGGCPELGAIPSVILGREVQVGCVPWRIADRRLGLSS